MAGNHDDRNIGFQRIGEIRGNIAARPFLACRDVEADTAVPQKCAARFAGDVLLGDEWNSFGAGHGEIHSAGNVAGDVVADGLRFKWHIILQKGLMSDVGHNACAVGGVKHDAQVLGEALAFEVHGTRTLARGVEHADLYRAVIETREDGGEFLFEIWKRFLASDIGGAILEEKVQRVLRGAREGKRLLEARRGDSDKEGGAILEDVKYAAARIGGIVWRLTRMEI